MRHKPYYYLIEEERLRFDEKVKQYYLSDTELQLVDIVNRFGSTASRTTLSKLLRSTGEYPHRGRGFSMKVRKAIKTPGIRQGMKPV